jgi:diguanylate cyclase (GGDEF)-like protein
MRELSLKARAYVLGSILAGCILLGVNFSSYQPGDIWLLVGLAILSSLSLVFKVIGATDRSHYNISFLIYAFSLVLLGVPATMIVIMVSNLVEWAWHRYPWYIQTFNISSYLVATQLAGLFYGLVDPQAGLSGPSTALVVVAALAIFTLVNHLMVGLVIWAARGETFTQSGIFDWFSLMLDFSLMCMGAALAFIWKLNPLAVLLGLAPLYLMRSTLRVPALERKSNTDPKTGLFNAEYFRLSLDRELARTDRYDRPLTVAIGDLDLLRNINNTYGHLAGDVVLKGVANILRRSFREMDVVARFGGEEFAVMMPEAEPEGILNRMQQIRAVIEETPFMVTTSRTPIHATISFGIAGKAPLEHFQANELLHNADLALYHAKLTGRNRVVIFSESSAQSLTAAQAKAGQPHPS